MKIIALHHTQFLDPKKQFTDLIYNGFQTTKTVRSIILIDKIILHKGQIYQETKTNDLINILGLTLQRKNIKTTLSIFDRLSIKYRKRIEVNKNYYLFLPHNRKKNNYWHCLIDNISQLLFIVQNYNVTFVIIQKKLGIMLRDYVFFLSKVYKFKIIEINEGTVELNGKGIFTNQSVKGFYFFNKENSEKLENQAIKFCKELNYKILERFFKFGFTTHKYVVKKNNSKMIIKNFSIPFSTPLRQSSILALRKLAIKLNKTNKKKEKNIKILIKRKNSDRQKNLLNEEAVDKIFLNNNFKSTYFENLNFKKQIDSCQKCRILAGTHGAGLVNVVFMKKNSFLINLYPKNYSIPPTIEYKTLCKILGINYVEIICEEMQKEFNKPESGNFFVNEKIIKQILKKINASK